MAPRVVQHPGTVAHRPHGYERTTVDEIRISLAGDGFHAAAAHHQPAENLEAHYASLERLECPWCFGGYLTITVEEDSQEREEAVPCKRCEQERRRVRP